MPFADQLEHKKSNLLQTLIACNEHKACPNGVSLPEWILKSREIGGLPCKLEGILESSLESGYHDKCEFSVGNSLQGNSTLDFVVGNFSFVESVNVVVDESPLNETNIISTDVYEILSDHDTGDMEESNSSDNNLDVDIPKEEQKDDEQDCEIHDEIQPLNPSARVKLNHPTTQSCINLGAIKLGN
ncbi:hypothetical protein RHSIM_Rhsim13G0156400 [Rhododendron simsii]|uniref:Uncharacterized protein n=1 Tax=Rhododendron simsii TaxID=118357 RepID=A0A834FZY4_RHOSS|nr:hypothetical protein RHSIM_Rhsim13G0156400 [Rhododendron simsii]